MIMKGGVTMKKKGISAVVATVLIILITVAAVTIIWAAIIPMINNKLTTGTICLDAVSQLTIEKKGYTCRTTGNDLKIQIGHGAKDFDLADIQVLISSEGNTESINLIKDGIIAYIDNLPGANEEKTFTIPDANITTPTANIDSISIAPIVKSGGGTVPCDNLDSVKIKLCN